MESFDEKNNLNLLLDNSAELTTEEIRNLLNELSSSEIAHALESSPPKQRKLFFSLLETNEELLFVLSDILLVESYRGWCFAKRLDDKSGLHLFDCGQGISGKRPLICCVRCLLKLVKRCNANFGCWQGRIRNHITDCQFDQ